MKKEELELIRKKYRDLIIKRDKLRRMEKVISEYEKMPEVKKYLDLKDKYRSYPYKYLEDKSHDYFLENAISNVNITPTNNIYVYMGTYNYEEEITNEITDYSINRNNIDSGYAIYYNLELKTSSSDSVIELPFNLVEEFEQSHTVICPTNIYNRGKYFYELQRDFFTTCILESEERAVAKVKKLIK